MTENEIRAAAVEFVGKYMRTHNDCPGAVDMFRAGIQYTIREQAKARAAESGPPAHLTRGETHA